MNDTTLAAKLAAVEAEHAVAAEPIRKLVSEYLTEWWGERCQAFGEWCILCRKWEALDFILSEHGDPKSRRRLLAREGGRAASIRRLRAEVREANQRADEAMEAARWLHPYTMFAIQAEAKKRWPWLID